MEIKDSQIKAQVANFKASVAADLYSTDDIVDLSAIGDGIDKNSFELAALDTLLARGPIAVAELADALISHPRLYGVLCALLSINSLIELEDGRRLPAPTNPPREAQSAGMVAEVLLELGLGQLLKGIKEIRPIYQVVMVAADAPRRRFRAESRLSDRIKRLVIDSLNNAATDSTHLYGITPTSTLPLSARRIVQYVVAVDGKPKVAIATTFQSHSGGRQTRDMSSLYPSVQATLRAAGLNLVLIADGQGMRALSDRVLTELLKSVPYTMSLAQAHQGGLTTALVELAELQDEPSLDTSAVHKLIQSAIEYGMPATAASLPVSDAIARLALASFASANSGLDLVLSPAGTSLTWRRDALIARLRALRENFNIAEARGALADLLGAIEVDNLHTPQEAISLYSLADDAVLSSAFAVGAYAGATDAQSLRRFVRAALQVAPKSRIAILLVSSTLGDAEVRSVRDAQAFLPVTVVVFDIESCLAIARSRDAPRDRLRILMLDQTDLTKISPFVVRGVTPARVFFGREEEEATLISTLSTNSVALLGGRRIGKTSLMQHSSRRLASANLRPFFGDCQVVRTWADFGSMAARNWGCKVPEVFKPEHLFGLVDELKGNSDVPIVIFLDEIDQLLDWDTSHSIDEVPEAFFRACRSISQQGLAQFVFSGERTIALRIWDAGSPHWNFCRPLMLRQLTRHAAKALVVEPLEALGVRIDDAEELVNVCWDSTDGHPELLQFLGDKIVSKVNGRDRTDVYASSMYVLDITNQFEYAEQYLETYWGQATALERVISVFLLSGSKTVAEISGRLDDVVPSNMSSSVPNALRMLELYGIAEQFDGGYRLRSLWFSTALSYYGGSAAVVKRYIDNIIS